MKLKTAQLFLSYQYEFMKTDIKYKENNFNATNYMQDLKFGVVFIPDICVQYKVTAVFRFECWDAVQ